QRPCAECDHLSRRIADREDHAIAETVPRRLALLLGIDQQARRDQVFDRRALLRQMIRQRAPAAGRKAHAMPRPRLFAKPTRFQVIARLLPSWAKQLEFVKLTSAFRPFDQRGALAPVLLLFRALLRQLQPGVARQLLD